MSTMPTIFESAEQSSSTELSDELTTALAAGRWWAIMEVSDPISEYPEYEDLISDQWWETVEEGETSCPTSLVFSDASEKAHSQHSGFSDGKYEEGELKTTKQRRQQNSPSAKKEDLTSSLVFSDSSEKVQHSRFSDATRAMDQRRNWREKKPQIAPVPAVSPKEAPVPIGSQKRGKLRIPEYLTKHLKKATLETPIPIQSLPPPVASSKVLTCSSHGGPIPDKISERRDPKNPELLRQHLQNAPVLESSPNLRIPEKQREKNIQKEAPVPLGSQKRGKLRIPEHLTKHLKKAALETPKPIQSLQRAPVASSKVLTCSSHGEPMPDKISERRDPKNPELLWQKNIQKGVSVPAKTPQRTLAPPCSPQQPPSSPEGAPMSRWSKSLWSTEASDNAGVCQAPPQKLCVELRRYNHPAPQITTSEPNRRTRNRLQPRSQPTRKRALDSAGVDGSPLQKKQRMEIKVNNQQSDPEKRLTEKEEAEKSLQQESMAIFVIRDAQAVPTNIGIILEEQEVLSDCCHSPGPSSFSLENPKTFEYIQKVIMELDPKGMTNKVKRLYDQCYNRA